MRLAIAQRAIRANDFDVCDEMLRAVQLARPKSSEAQLLFGDMLYQAGRTEEFSSWIQSTRNEFDDQAKVWVLRGHYYRQQRDLATAYHSYLNAFERDRFLKAAHEQDIQTSNLCLTLLYSGCRLTEALNLSPENLQPAENVLLIRSLKKRGAMCIRHIPVPEFLLDRLIYQGQNNSKSHHKKPHHNHQNKNRKRY